MIWTWVMLFVTITPALVMAEVTAIAGERVIVSSKATNTHAYPSLARLEDNRLLCVYSDVAPDTRVLSVAATFSEDHGKTWSAPIILLRNDDISYYDPAIVVIGQRVLVTSTAVQTSHGALIVDSKTTAVRSDDNARTWSAPYDIPMPYRYTSGKVNNGIVLKDGTVLFGYTWEKNLETVQQLHSEGDMEEVNAVMISHDHGDTWQAGGSVGLELRRPSHLTDAINGLCEPAILERADGSIYMLSRTGLDRLYQSVSFDQGKTWSAAEPTDLVSHNAPASLCEFTSDQGKGWLVVWNHSATVRWPLSVAASFDEGRTWTAPQVLANTPGYQASYPGCIQAADGSLVVVYQQDNPDQARQIIAVRFTVDALHAVVHAPCSSNIPVERQEASSKQRHADIVARMKETHPDIVFIGDSITQRWESAGLDSWNAFYAQRNAFNMGRDGDGTQTLLWRLNNSPLHLWSPEVAVVLIGTANWTDARQTPEMVAAGIAAVVAKLRLQWPQTRVLVLPVFPRFDYETATWERRQEITRLLTPLIDQQMVFSLDISDAFTGPNHAWRKEIMPDKVHLSAEGYRLWGEAMEPMMQQLLQAGP